MTNSCSMVPRSFSRTAAAAGSMMDMMVITTSSSESGMNQASFWLGLYQTRCSLWTIGTFSRALALWPSRASA